jgi:hypothetical protein
MKTIVNLSLIAIVALTSPAIAQDQTQAHDLYSNRDGKAFSFERSFPSLAACDAAAKSMWQSKRVLGAGCKPSTQAPAVAGPNRGAAAAEQKADPSNARADK